MEDIVIKKGHYAYQFRVDISHNIGLTRVMEFLKKYNVEYYIVGAETSELGKEHFQCVLWFTSQINTAKLRNWWKGKTSPTKQPVSMTSAKKIKNLGKYTMKDKNFTTNLTKEEVSLIGQWKPKVKEEQWKLMLEEHAKKFDEKLVDEFDVNEYGNMKISNYNSKTRVHTFVVHILQFYRKHGKRPHRATIQYLAWKHGHMDDIQLAIAWF